MAAFGLALLQLEADDEAMEEALEEEELQEEEEQLNMLMHFTMAPSIARSPAPQTLRMVPKGCWTVLSPHVGDFLERMYMLDG